MIAQAHDDTWEARGERLRIAREAAIARFPKTCPECGGDDLLPMFEPDRNLWECEACSWIFEVTP